jgi:translation initiation factor 1
VSAKKPSAQAKTPVTDAKATVTDAKATAPDAKAAATDAKATAADAATSSASTKTTASKTEAPPSNARPTPTQAKPAPTPQRISVRIERTGRGGKTVTIAEGPGLHGRKLEPLAREIARGMGTGARVESSAIVVQGDQRERLVVWLGAHGFSGAVAGN